MILLWTAGESAAELAVLADKLDVKWIAQFALKVLLEDDALELALRSPATMVASLFRANLGERDKLWVGVRDRIAKAYNSRKLEVAFVKHLSFDSLLSLLSLVPEDRHCNGPSMTTQIVVQKANESKVEYIHKVKAAYGDEVRHFTISVQPKGKCLSLFICAETSSPARAQFTITLPNASVKQAHVCADGTAKHGYRTWGVEWVLRDLWKHHSKDGALHITCKVALAQSALRRGALLAWAQHNGLDTTKRGDTGLLQFLSPDQLAHEVRIQLHHTPKHTLLLLLHTNRHAAYRLWLRRLCKRLYCATQPHCSQWIRHPTSPTCPCTAC